MLFGSIETLGEELFETASDSETILHLFRTNDDRWTDRLDGMFAFVLATKDRIIAARDPLYKAALRCRARGGVYLFFRTQGI